MSTRVFLLFVLLLAGCASNRFEDDKANSRYQKSGYAAEARYSKESAAGAVIGSAIALAGNRDYYRSSAITGKLNCQSAAAQNISIPCQGVTVLLYDSKGKELGKSQDTKDEFAFKVEKGRAYRIRIESTYFQPRDTLDGDIFQGDDLVITLLKRSALRPEPAKGGTKQRPTPKR